MAHHTLAQQKYLEAAQLFHWATREHFVIWFTGTTKRHRRTEMVLPALAKKYEDEKTRKYSLFATMHRKKLVYSCPRRVRNPDLILKIDHGLGCTECLVRLWRANMEAEIIQERQFYRGGCVPDFGLSYPGGKMLLCEYSSEDNFNRHNKIKNKVAAYKKFLPQIQERFGMEAVVLFVLDVTRMKVQRLVDKLKPTGLPVFFTDYEMFKRIGIGQQLAAPIYIWGEDGLSYPLVNHAQPPHS